jgi:hypothetical protein
MIHPAAYPNFSKVSLFLPNLAGAFMQYLIVCPGHAHFTATIRINSHFPHHALFGIEFA